MLGRVDGSISDPYSYLLRTTDKRRLGNGGWEPMKTRSWRARSLFAASAIAVTVAIGLGAVALVGDISAAAAKAPAKASAVTSRSYARPLTHLTNEVLKATYVESGNPDTSLPASTEVAIDPVNTIKCPAAAGGTCTITDTVSLQEYNGPAYGDNYMAAPWQVNGTTVGLGGPFFTVAPSDGGYAGGTWTDFDHGVTPGKHHVQTFAYSDDGANLGYWTITYSVYEP